MVPWLGFNPAETTLGQAQQKPNWAKAPMVEEECKENPAQGKLQEGQYVGNRDSKSKQIPEDLWLR